VVILASGAGSAVAMGVGGIVAVLVVSVVFYVIGRGEDRDRATPAPAAPAEAAPDDASAPGAASEPGPAHLRARRPRATERRRRRP
jgi:hypothetical protein